MIHNAKPDYEFDAYLKCEGQHNVLCNVAIWLPKNAEENVQIEIDSPEKFNILENFIGELASIESEIYQENPIFDSKISKVRIKQITTQIEQRKLQRTRIQLHHADNLIISERVGLRDVQEQLIKHIYFQLSSHEYASPEFNRAPSYLGSRKADLEKAYAATLPDGSICEIERHYSGYTNISKGKEVVNYQNVLSIKGNCEFDVSAIDKLYMQANDFVLLLSFAARHPVMTLGYEYWTENNRVRFFKNPIDRFITSHDEEIKDALIPTNHFELFMNGALKIWFSMGEKDRLLIKDAIAAIHPFNDSTQSYLDMFSALRESLN